MELVLHGSPHSLPTYKVALALRLSGLAFRFRYVSFRDGRHREPDFLALSRWGQVPVLTIDGVPHVQSSAIIETVAAISGRFAGSDPESRQAVREWLWWEADVLFPPIFACYGISLGDRKLLPISVEPPIRRYFADKAAAALDRLEGLLSARTSLCGAETTLADIVCLGDVVFAELCGLAPRMRSGLADWIARQQALPGYAGPFELLAMNDLEIAAVPAGER